MGKPPTAAILGGVLLNQKLNPATLENESDKQKLMILLRTFFEVHKGWQIQYNIVSAKRCWRRKNIRIRSAHPGSACRGSSAFFTALSPDASRHHRSVLTDAVISSARLRRRWLNSHSTTSISSLLHSKI
ncbi:glycine radical domain-containing protein [Escherichia coli]